MAKVKRSKTPITVYWSINTDEDMQYQMLLMSSTFKSVMRDITTRRSRKTNDLVSSYHSCPALQNLADSMFFIPVPFDVDIELNEDGSIRPHRWMQFFGERPPTIENAFNVDFDYQLNVFCEEPLEMTVTPPYLHQTAHSQLGFISAVKWDISKWFRPITPAIQLWPGIRELRLRKDEPLLYVNFDTDRPIVFKQVRYTDRMRKIYTACGQFKFYHKFAPLNILYDKFVKQGLRNDLLKEIKENIIKESDV
jgi:hypothetical protein